MLPFSTPQSLPEENDNIYLLVLFGESSARRYKLALAGRLAFGVMHLSSRSAQQPSQSRSCIYDRHGGEGVDERGTAPAVLLLSAHWRTLAQTPVPGKAAFLPRVAVFLFKWSGNFRSDLYPFALSSM